MGAIALVVAFLSASQDIVIDAWRVEILPLGLQGPGAGMIQTGYRIGMLVSGAGTLVIAARAGWFAAYATMAAMLAVGVLVFVFGPEPRLVDFARPNEIGGVTSGSGGFSQWLSTAVFGPFADFMRRPVWPVILLFILGYKLGEAMAGMMATPLYVSLGFSLDEIAAVSKLVGFFATVAGALIGGLVTARFGILRSLMLCGLLQSAGNLFYVLQAVGGHKLAYLALCVTTENVTGAMAGTALVGYLSSLCSPAFTATQYALLSSIAVVGRTLVASSSGILSERLGWVPFFLLTTVVTMPALLLLVWIERHEAAHSRRESALAAVTKT
jgi:PAT family beta-lactamase induction signal transducer AmpG